MMAHDKALMTAYRIQHCPARRFNHEIRLSDLTETPGPWDASKSCAINIVWLCIMTGGRLGNTYGFKRLLRGVRHRHSLRWGAALLDRRLIVARLARGATGALARRRSWQCARLGGIADSSPSCRRMIALAVHGFGQGLAMASSVTYQRVWRNLRPVWPRAFAGLK